MYKKIINPETGRAVNVNGRVGKNVLRKYISNNNLKGGAAGFFNFFSPTPSDPMDEVNNIMTRINEAMQLVQAKQGEWQSLNIIESTKAREIELLQKDMMKLQKYAQKIQERPQQIQQREQQKEQSKLELDTCNKQLLENELRCKSLEKTKLDTDTEYENWIQSSSVKVAETLPQIDDIVDRITATNERLNEESEKRREIGGNTMGNRDDMSAMMTNESMYNSNIGYGNTAYGNTAYGNTAYGNNVYGNTAYGNTAYDYNAYGGSKKNAKKNNLSKNNKKKKNLIENKLLYK